MSISFECPACGNRLSAPDGAAGKVSNCGCGASVRVPAAAPRVLEGIPLSAGRSAAGVKASCELCGKPHPGPEAICESCREGFGATRCEMCGKMSGGGKLCPSCRASLGPSRPAGAGASTAPAAPPKKCSLATAALVCGLLGFLCFGFMAIPAVICGHLARTQIRESGGQLTGDASATWGLVLGYISLVLWGLMVLRYTV